MNITRDLTALKEQIRELEYSLKTMEQWAAIEGERYDGIRQKCLYDSKRLFTLKRMLEIISPDSTAI